KGRHAPRQRRPYLGLESVVFDLEQRLVGVGLRRRRHAADRVRAFGPEPQPAWIDGQRKMGWPLAAVDDINRAPARADRQVDPGPSRDRCCPGPGGLDDEIAGERAARGKPPRADTAAFDL